MRRETLDRALSLFRKVLRRSEDDGSRALPEDLEATEFRELQAEIGAVLDDTPSVDLRDATIAELQHNLAQLRPLGDMLAQAERRRVATEQQLARLMEAHAELQRERDEEEADAAPPRAVARLEQSLARTRERLEATRAKLDEKRIVAGERWKEITALKGRARAAEKALAAERRLLKQVRAQVAKLLAAEGGAPAGVRSKLAELMQVDGSAGPQSARAARRPKKAAAKGTKRAPARGER